jgi:3-dehydroquinate synthase
MKELHVSIESHSYSVYVGQQLLTKLPQLLEQHGVGIHQKLFLVTDSHVGPLHAEQVDKILCSAGFQVSVGVIPAGESSKSFATLDELYTTAIQSGLNRSSVVLALGGGVVGDLAGFFAASFMRGIPFVQLPTTLLSHDSSIGGKVGINHSLGKNYIGAFHQPLFVLFDVNLLVSLPERELNSGFAEVVKHALIWDKEFVSWLESNHTALKDRDLSALSEAIYRGCAVKVQVVSSDEREMGIRAILNYGHTIGHALEAVSGYKFYTHGEAIAIGMAGSARLSVSLMGAPVQLVEQTESLLQLFSLPTRFFEPWSDESLLQAMKRDKKVKQGSYTFVLAEDLGKVSVVNDVSEYEIKKVISTLRGGE